MSIPRNRRIIERVRELNGSPSSRRDTPRESGLEERDRLRRRIRKLLETRHTMFDQGFDAAVAMVRGGADLERLEAARGIIDVEIADTEPIDMRPLETHEDQEFELFELVHDTLVDG